MVRAYSRLNVAAELFRVVRDHAGFLQQGVGLEKKILQNITRDLQVELAENMFIKDGFRERLLARAKKKETKTREKKNIMK